MGLEDVQYIFTYLSSVTSHFVLAGDLNIDLLQTSSVKYQYSDLLVDFHLVQHITQPSRYSSISATLIDHVHAGVNDHQVQIVCLFLPVPKIIPHVFSVQSFCNCSWKDLHEALLTAPWQLSIYDDIDDIWDFFQATLQYCLDQYVPLRRCIVNTLDDLLLGLYQNYLPQYMINKKPERSRDPSDF